jgi:uncharacterized protein
MYRRKSKRGALRLETYFSTQPPAPGKNARLSHSYENSGGAQCVAAPPSEEPSSLDSLKSSFDLSSIPQDFSAATPKRVSASLRRRAAAQRITMHGLLPAQRLTSFTLGHHHAGAVGDCGPAQSSAAASARSLSLESHEPSGRMGHSGESPRGSGESPFRHPSEGTLADLSSEASATICVTSDREMVTGLKMHLGAVPSPPKGAYLPLILGGVLKSVALGLIRVYQLMLSPLLFPACRHYPTCSAYAFEAIDKWGIREGARLAVRRLLRCRPWGTSGYDPVPERQGLGTRD